MLFVESLNEQALQLLDGLKKESDNFTFGRPASAPRGHASDTAAVGDNHDVEEAPTTRSTPSKRPRCQKESADAAPVQSPAEGEPEPCPQPAETTDGAGSVPVSESASRAPSAIPPLRMGRQSPCNVEGGTTASPPRASSEGPSVLARRGDMQEKDVLDIAQDVESNNMMRLLSTPRAREACKRLGILPNELRVKRLQDFAVIGDLPERQQMRFNHFENKRQQKLKEVLGERSKIVQEQMEKEVSGPACVGFQALQMMEDMLDQEAKRMERDLKAQSRLHSIAEKHNEELLVKERRRRQREDEQNRAREKAEALREQKVLQIRSQSEAKFRRQAELAGQAEREFAERNMSIVLQHEDEDLRLQEFLREKQERAQDRSEQWQQRMEVIERRQESLMQEREATGVSKLVDYQRRLDILDQRRDSELKHKLMRHEEQSLRLVDAHEKRKQLERLEHQRRQEVANKLENQQQRVETLLSVKEQILEQRRVRNQQGGPKIADVQTVGPGPAAYDPKPSCVTEAAAPKISSARSKSLVTGSIDAAVARARSQPAPGQYDPKVLPSGDGQWDGGGPVMRGGERRQTYLDQQAREARHVPGPGAYHSDQGSMKPKHGVKIGRDYVSGLPPRPPAWAKTGDSCTPGPAAYNIDPTGRRRLLRAHQSLPMLAKALVA